VLALDLVVALAFPGCLFSHHLAAAPPVPISIGVVSMKMMLTMILMVQEDAFFFFFLANIVIHNVAVATRIVGT
jgi:hypothetical protein